MENFGPLRQHACFRCEAKNGLIKSLDYQNFINICFSAAEKHQLWMTSVELEQKMRKSLKYTDDICKTNDKSNIDSFFFDDLKPKSYLGICKYLKKDGFQYVPGGYLILDFNLNDNELDFLDGTQMTIASLSLLAEMGSSEYVIVDYVVVTELSASSNCLLAITRSEVS